MRDWPGLNGPGEAGQGTIVTGQGLRRSRRSSQRAEQPVPQARRCPDDDRVGAGLLGHLPQLVQRAAAPARRSRAPVPQVLRVVGDLGPDLRPPRPAAPAPRPPRCPRRPSRTGRRGCAAVTGRRPRSVRPAACRARPGRVGQRAQRRRRAVDADHDRPGTVGAEFRLAVRRAAPQRGQAPRVTVHIVRLTATGHPARRSSSGRRGCMLVTTSPPYFAAPAR